MIVRILTWNLDSMNDKNAHLTLQRNRLNRFREISNEEIIFFGFSCDNLNWILMSYEVRKPQSPIHCSTHFVGLLENHILARAESILLETRNCISRDRFPSSDIRLVNANDFSQCVMQKSRHMNLAIHQMGMRLALIDTIHSNAILRLSPFFVIFSSSLKNFPFEAEYKNCHLNFHMWILKRSKDIERTMGFTHVPIIYTLIQYLCRKTTIH